MSSHFLLGSVYDNAVCLAQKGEWDGAYNGLNSLLINDPDNSSLLYDAGICAYNAQHHEPAYAYFSQSAEYAQDNNLKKQALFNAGNACVSCTRLHNALDCYEKVLSIDSHDQCARYNRDKVMQMLKEQEKQNEKNDKSQSDCQNQPNQDQDNSNQQSGKDSSDKDSNQQDNQNQDSSSADSQSNKNSQKNDSSSSNKQESKSDKDSSESNQADKDAADVDQNKDKREQESTQSKQGQDGEKDKQWDQKSDFKDKANQEKSDKSDNDYNQHVDTPKKDIQKSQSTQGDSKDKENNQIMDSQDVQASQEQGQEGLLQAIQEKLNDPILLRILEEQEKKDQAISKRIMEANIRRNGGKNGQNAW